MSIETIKRGSGAPSEAYYSERGWGRIQLRLPDYVLNDLRILARERGQGCAELVAELITKEARNP